MVVAIVTVIALVMIVVAVFVATFCLSTRMSTLMPSIVVVAKNESRSLVIVLVRSVSMRVAVCKYDA